MSVPEAVVEPAALRRLRWAMAGLLALTTAAHVARPRAFDVVVPRWLPGPARAWNAAATLTEAGAAVLLARRATARAGGAVAFTTLAVVYVANVDAALRDGTPGLRGWLGSRQAAILRLPLQIPLLWAAWRILAADGRGRVRGE